MNKKYIKTRKNKIMNKIVIKYSYATVKSRIKSHIKLKLYH